MDRTTHTGKYSTPRVLGLISIILFGIAISIIVVLHYFRLVVDNYLTMLDASIPTAAVGAVTFIIFYYQSKQEKVRDDLLFNYRQILDQIGRLSYKQDRIQHYSVRGPLIGIAYQIYRLYVIIQRTQSRSLQQFDSRDISEIQSGCITIKDEADSIRNFIGVIYEEIGTCIKYLDNCMKPVPHRNSDSDKDSKNHSWVNWEDELDKAKHQLDIVSDHIDLFLFDPLWIEDFTYVDFTTVLGSNKMIIVVGTKLDHQNMSTKMLEADFEASKRLLNSIKKINDGDDYSSIIKMDKDPDINKEDSHLILVGGPTVNNFLASSSIGTELPLQYVQVHGDDKFYSRITKKLYNASDCSAVIQAIKSPFSKDKIIICAFGLDRYDTDKSIQVLIDLFNKKIKEAELRNKALWWCTARMIKKKSTSAYDRDYDFVE